MPRTVAFHVTKANESPAISSDCLGSNSVGVAAMRSEDDPCCTMESVLHDANVLDDLTILKPLEQDVSVSGQVETPLSVHVMARAPASDDESLAELTSCDDLVHTPFYSELVNSEFFDSFDIDSTGFNVREFKNIPRRPGSFSGPYAAGACCTSFDDRESRASPSLTMTTTRTRRLSTQEVEFDSASQTRLLEEAGNSFDLSTSQESVDRVALWVAAQQELLLDANYVESPGRAPYNTRISESRAPLSLLDRCCTPHLQHFDAQSISTTKMIYVGSKGAVISQNLRQVNDLDEKRSSASGFFKHVRNIFQKVYKAKILEKNCFNRNCRKVWSFARSLNFRIPCQLQLRKIGAGRANKEMRGPSSAVHDVAADGRLSTVCDDISTNSHLCSQRCSIQSASPMGDKVQMGLSTQVAHFSELPTTRASWTIEESPDVKSWTMHTSNKVVNTLGGREDISDECSLCYNDFSLGSGKSRKSMRLKNGYCDLMPTLTKESKPSKDSEPSCNNSTVAGTRYTAITSNARYVKC